MDPTRLLAAIHRHQDAILALIDDARPWLSRSGEEARAEIARRRWELVRLLRAYQLCKHGELFDPMIHRGDPARQVMAAAMKARCVEMGEAFAAHARLWSGAGIAEAWPDYVRAGRAMADRIEAHLRRERAECAGLLAGTRQRVRAELRVGGRRAPI